MSLHQNITRIKAVFNALEELANDVVFVGGATVALYADRPSNEVRPTDDVDILVELLNYSGYSEIDAKLRAKGFENDIESGVICRYRVNGVIVDVMPTEENVLGFSNIWYPEGFRTAMYVHLDEHYKVKIFQPAWFIASKLEAFNGRGDNDGRLSSDFEDIVFVLNNRNSIWEELEAAPELLRNYLQHEFGNLLSQPYMYEWVGVHLDYNEQNRVSHIIGGLQKILL
jgi:predicted nucleotidyltransferase